MKNLLALAVLASAFACSAANAAILTVEPGASNTFALYLNGEATTFNGVGLSVKPNGAAVFSNVNSGLAAGVPRPSGQAFSYRNRLLDTPTDDPDIAGGKGWTLLGIVNTAAEIAFSGGPLGQNISTAGEAGGKLFLANVMLPQGGTAGGTAVLQLVNGVDTVHSQTLVFGGAIIPEPATLALAGMGLVGMVAVSRRRKA